MWTEPLAAESEPTASHTVVVRVRDATGAAVAEVTCAYSRESGAGAFGEMRVIDDAGAPRQRSRALVLLVREALRLADSLDLTQVMTEAPDHFAAFAERMSGLAAMDAAGRRMFAGELHAVRTHALATTSPDGELLDARGLPEREGDADAAVDLPR